MRRYATITSLAILAWSCEPSGAQPPSNVTFIHADAVHAQNITGLGVTVAVIDVGIDYTDPGLAGHIASGGMSRVNGMWTGNGSASPGDTHGTFMSLIVGQVAPDAMILPIKAIGGSCVWPDVPDAITYVVKRKKSDPTIRVMNLSFGGEEHYQCQCDFEDWVTTILAPALDDALDAGIIAFACTGNHGHCGGIEAPACLSRVVRVAAIYDTPYPFPVGLPCAEPALLPSLVTCFSDIPDDCAFLLGAPGYNIIAGGLGAMWGTSAATAHASGVAALMYEKNACGGLDPDSARRIIYNHSAGPCLPRVGCALDIPNQLNALSAVNAVATVDCTLFGDLNCDGTIDAADFRHMLHCVKGPNGQASIGFCGCGNFPQRRDDVVDMHDFAQFQLAFTGYGSGACCHADGTCSIVPVNVCAEEFGATYQGHDATCVGVECPLPDWGACCNIATLACTESTREDCIWGEPGQGDEGVYLGDGTHCAAATCPMVLYHNVIDPLTTYAECGPGLQLADDIRLAGAEEPSALTYYAAGVYGGSTSFFDVTIGLYRDYPSFGLLIPGTERTFTDIPNYGSPVFLTATFDPPIDLPDDFWMVVKFSDPSCGWFLAGDSEIGDTWDLFSRCDPPWGEYWYGGDPFASLWADIGCIPSQQGACCWTWEGDWYCTEGSRADCDWVGGYFQGFATACAGTDCNTVSFGACCSYEDGACTQVSPEFCAAYGRVYQGDGTSCSETTCPYGRYRNDVFSCAWYEIQDTALALGDDMTLAGTGARELVYYSLLVYGGWSTGGSQHDPFDVTVELYTACPGDGGTLIDGTTFTWHDVPDDATGQLLEVDLSGSPVTIPDTVWMVAQFSKPQAGWAIGGTAEVGSTLDRYGANEPPWSCNYYYPCGPHAGFWANLRCEAPGGLRSGASPVLTITPVALEVAPVPLAVGESVGQRRGEDSVPSREREGILVPAGGTPVSQRWERRLDPRPVRVLPGGAWNGPSSRGGAKSRSTATVTLDLTSPLAGHRVPPGSVIEWSVNATVSQGDNAGLALIVVDLVQDPANPELFDLSPAAPAEGLMEVFDRANGLGISNPGPGGEGSAYGGTQMGPAGAMNLVQIGGAQNTFGEAGDAIGTYFQFETGVGLPGPELIAHGSFIAPATEGVYAFQLEKALANVLNVVDPVPTPPDFWPVSAAEIVLLGSSSMSFTVGGEVICLPGDLNGDDVIDGRDIQTFVAVSLNAGGASPQQFCAADMMEDGVLDDNDLRAFAFTLLSMSHMQCVVGDVNQDGELNGLDIQSFVTAIMNPSEASLWQSCAADCDGNEVLGANDTGPFVAVLMNPGG